MAPFVQQGTTAMKFQAASVPAFTPYLRLTDVLLSGIGGFTHLHLILNKGTAPTVNVQAFANGGQIGAKIDLAPYAQEMGDYDKVYVPFTALNVSGSQIQGFDFTINPVDNSMPYFFIDDVRVDAPTQGP
jgi:hypothetical protein